MSMLLGLCDIFSVSADYLIHDDYESDEDIPVVKEKNEKISAAKEKEKVLTLLAGVCYAIATLCFCISASIHTHPAAIPFFLIAICANVGLSVYWFIRFSKIK